MGPCRKRVLLQVAVSGGIWCGKETHTGYPGFDAPLFLLAADGSLEERTEDRVHPVLVAWRAGWTSMAKCRGDEREWRVGHVWERYRDRDVRVGCG